MYTSGDFGREFRALGFLEDISWRIYETLIVCCRRCIVHRLRDHCSGTKYTRCPGHHTTFEYSGSY